MDKTKIDQALERMSASFLETPKYIVLLRRNGEFVSRIGTLASVNETIDDNLVASLTYAHALSEIGMLDGLQHGTFQFSISIGGSGAYLIFHLNDAYLLGISYQSIGIKSIDGVIESVLDHFQELLETLYWLEAPR